MTYSFKILQNTTEKKPAYFVRQEVSVPIYSFNLKNEISSESILERALAFRKANDQNEKNELVVDGYQTPYFKKDINLFDDLLGIITNKAKFATNRNYVVKEYWLVFYNKGTSHKIHNHTKTNKQYPMSAVYYPIVDKNSTPIVFKNNIGNSEDELEIKVEEGTLLIFNSELLHYVPECTSDDLRVAFSCNMWVN